MSIRYSGGPYVNSTFTQSSGTRGEIVTNVVSLLTSAGWSVYSGSGTDVVMQSGTTAESLTMRVRVYDAGSGTGARIAIKNTGGTCTSQDYYLNPGVGKTWRVVACPFQFFVYTSRSGAYGGEFVACGTPALPAWLNGVTTECAWINGNCLSDGGTVIGSFRASWCAGSGDYYSRWSGFRNGTLLDRAANNDYYRSGDLTMTSGGSARSSFPDIGSPGLWFATRWVDGSLAVYDPCVAFSVTGIGNEGFIQGQVWDGLAVNQPYKGDSIINFGGHNAIAIMDNNAPNSTSSTSHVIPGTLFIVYS
jgi:hypothetical protein